MRIKRSKDFKEWKIEHNKVLFYIILFLIVILLFIVFQIRHLNKEKASEINNATDNNENKMCGGIAGIICPEGYTCDMQGKTYPDASGICVEKISKK